MQLLSPTSSREVSVVFSEISSSQLEKFRSDVGSKAGIDSDVVAISNILSPCLREVLFLLAMSSVSVLPAIRDIFGVRASLKLTVMSFKVPGREVTTCDWGRTETRHDLR